MVRLILALCVASSGCGDEVPWFESVLSPVDTYDTVGPYLVEAWVNAPRGVARLTLRVTNDPTDPRFGDIAMVQVAGDDERGRYRTQLPGRSTGTGTYYYLVLVDRRDRVVSFPEAAPDGLLGFFVRAVPGDR